MSSPAAAIVKPEPRLLTPEASNVLTWWWLAITTTIVLLCAMWPSIFEGETGGLSATSTYLLVIISAVLVGIGAWCSLGFARAQAWSASTMRLITMILLGVGLAGVGYFLYSVAFATPATGAQSFWGPNGVLSGTLWALMILLPFIFGLTLIFGLMNDAVDEWFNPPAYDPTAASLRVLPGAGAAMGERALESEIDEAMELTDKNAVYDDDQSVEVIGSSEEDLSVEVIGDSNDGTTESSDSMAELAALEQALTKKAATEKSNEKLKKKEEKKYEAGKGDEPLAVDDDFKL